MPKKFSAFVLAGGIVFGIVDPIRADSATSFTTDETHAYYVKGFCPEYDVSYDALVAGAKAKGLDPTLVEQIQNGVIFLNSNGKNGIEPPKAVMSNVIFAAKLVNMDTHEIGVQKWCDFRAASLMKSGYLLKK